MQTMSLGGMATQWITQILLKSFSLAVLSSIVVLSVSIQYTTIPTKVCHVPGGMLYTYVLPEYQEALQISFYFWRPSLNLWRRKLHLVTGEHLNSSIDNVTFSQSMSVMIKMSNLCGFLAYVYS